MTQSDAGGTAWAVPIFPLPRVVLMPGAVLPLHVFEPRYVALVEHVLEGDGLMGIATLKPGYGDEYHGSPPIFGTFGVGRLVSHQRVQDGRFNIVLRFVERVRVVREMASDDPFRWVEALRDAPDADGVEAALLQLKVLLLQLGSQSGAGVDEVSRVASMSGMRLADSIARRVVEKPEARLRYLGAERLVQRVGMVHDHLANLLVMSGDAEA